MGTGLLAGGMQVEGWLMDAWFEDGLQEGLARVLGACIVAVGICSMAASVCVLAAGNGLVVASFCMVAACIFLVVTGACTVAVDVCLVVAGACALTVDVCTLAADVCSVVAGTFTVTAGDSFIGYTTISVRNIPDTYPHLSASHFPRIYSS
ncbi:hypothetical protein DSO57_1003644 [Entomophthora muscae]|uniref:Uncharacterized protein n=1 Tax=Entomophthora muscae TaxID=34485 RepID=A0ACC2SL41_9FUNG|nr:hypothetical protein DSO57_1003644 [Entomophthora muscae]